MAYRICQNIEECKEQLKELVDAFNKGHAEFTDSKYSEAQVRIDFLNPLLKCFGWDVDNEAKKTQLYREVIQEESIDIEEEDKITKKNPDYTLKQFGVRSFFVEAKKASIDIVTAKNPAFQIRRYGWSANLPFSVLTNFEHLVIYDCTSKPEVNDAAAVNRFKVFHFTTFLHKIEELYALFSFEAVKSGSLDSIETANIKGEDSFDAHFLSQIENWRHVLAENVVANNADLTQDGINYLIQRLINKIIFLRICEDREIEKYETLKNISDYDELKQLFIYSDKKYNSGLFNYIEEDLAQQITIDDQVLIDIFAELYYPISPYDFSVIDSDILSQIYEQYLGNKIELAADYSVSIVQEPEVVASNGVVPTPKRIVKQIITETLDTLFSEADFERTLEFKIADICCGSGTFLLSVFDYIIHYRETHYFSLDTVEEGYLTEMSDNQFRLSLREKHNILVDNVFGVDINPYAVEVAHFSLLLRLIENENALTIQSFLDSTGKKVLPSLEGNIKCGNSLLDDNFFTYNENAEDDDELLYKINPFNWEYEFPFLIETNGFDAIVGNPPYVRIQNFVKYSPEEVEYYRSKVSPYTYTKKDLFDKYYLFIERAIMLLREGGRVGFIVPHKFFIVKGGKKLRGYITTTTSLDKIIHFGVTQIFPDRSTYTAIIVLYKEQKEYLEFSRIDSLSAIDVFSTAPIVNYRNSNFNSDPWVFVSENAAELFNRIVSSETVPLKNIAEIPVGLQTSADPIYIFSPIQEDATHYYFSKKSITYKVEKGICRACLYDVSFNSFDTVEANSQMIFPYDIVDGNAHLISDTVLQSNFPDCWAYLNLFKNDLEKRSINGADPKWYQYGRNQSLTKFHNTDKIIFPVLSTSSSYVIDTSNFQFTGGGNGPYYSIVSKSEYSIYYLAGLLSHPVLEAMVKSRASEFRGAYYSHGKQFIENLPIKTIDFNNPLEKRAYNQICCVVKSIIETKNRLDNIKIYANRSVMDRKLNRLYNYLYVRIDHLYGFSNDDIDSIKEKNLFIAPIES
ncbi:Eco57I restriction-modification methylase domain-containing protein [Aequorivita vladivostokensis]|uniref:site-specific DNA-methyltransferase (adenine-specific) n=1 Tax=Aequorivita vladivostokensis TaxID=171194 RepID=A0ABR5DKJ0_9FLAO|nr:N-6 DNA methylase [Aequorivita vladivostokensis]KJJ39307.1 endonuclease [Aequorivita vladivostokensis]